MTKLAMYDRQYGPRDKKNNEYYRHDYTYRKNMWTRLCAAIGAIIILVIYWLYQLYALNQNFLDIGYQKAGVNAAVFVLAVMAVYTVIGTIRETAQFAKSQRRLKNYMRMLYMLDRIKEPEPEPSQNTTIVNTKEESGLYYGADIAGKRDNNTVV